MTESALQQAVQITDRLRSPGGCPWDARQTHTSLAPYLLEETYETLDAIETGDAGLLREELGDVLFQVILHARLAQEAPVEQRFSLEDVAADLVEKLTRRHPHVFAGAAVDGAEELEANWDSIKQHEKQRASAVDGIARSQPALSFAAKLVNRARRAGVQVEPVAESEPDTEALIGAQLLEVVQQAQSLGVDPELALRRAARGYEAAVRSAEFDAATPPAR